MVTHTVSVDGRQVEANVTNVTITHGRSDPSKQPDPSTATLELVDLRADSFIPGQRVTVTSGGRLRYAGRIVDVSAGWIPGTTPIPTVQLITTGDLANLGRVTVGLEAWPVETDGARIARIITSATHATRLGLWDATHTGNTSAGFFSPPESVGTWAGLKYTQVGGVDSGGTAWLTVANGAAGIETGEILTWRLRVRALALSPLTISGFWNEYAGTATVPADGEWRTVVVNTAVAADKWLRVQMQFPGHPNVAGQWVEVDTATVYAGPAIDLDPGSVELTARPADRASALQLAQAVAESSGGLLGQYIDGTVYYHDANRRSHTSTPTFTFTPALIQPPTHDRADRVTTAVVEYGADLTPRPSVTVRDTVAVTKWGETEARVTTILNKESDARALAARILTRWGGDWWDTPAVTIPLEIITDPTALLDLEVGDSVALTGAPAGWPGPARFWCEGWTETITPDRHTITLAISDAARFGSGIRWNSTTLEPAYVWTFDTSVDGWANVSPGTVAHTTTAGRTTPGAIRGSFAGGGWAGVAWGRADVTVGDELTLTAWVRSEGDPITVTAYVNVNGAGDALVGQTSKKVTATSSAWTPITVTYTAPAGALTANLWIDGGSSSTANALLLDDVTLTSSAQTWRNTAGRWFDETTGV